MFDISLVLNCILAGVMLGGLYAILAVGLNLIFSTMRIPNMSHGAFVMLGMYIAYWCNTLFGFEALALLPLAFVIMLLAGMFVMRFSLQPIIDKEASPLLLTYGLQLILVNAAQLAWTGEWRVLKVPYRGASLMYGLVHVSLPDLIAFIFAVFLFSALYVFLMKTKMGMATRAIAQNATGARVVGINVEKLRMIDMGIGLGLGGAGGVLFSLIYPIYPSVAPLFTGKTLAICVLGGLGSVEGAFFGAIILGLAETLSIFLVPYNFKDAVGFMIFILILSIKPSGLFGKAVA